jgi:hypothetical protein
MRQKAMRMTGIQTRVTENTTVYGYVSIRSQIHSRLFLSKEWAPIPAKLRHTSNNPTTYKQQHIQIHVIRNIFFFIVKFLIFSKTGRRRIF